MIGNISGEIGPAPVRFLQWAVDIIAETGRAKQILFAVFPVIRFLTLGRFQSAPVNQIALFEFGYDIVDCFVFMKRPLGCKNIVRYAER